MALQCPNPVVGGMGTTTLTFAATFSSSPTCIIRLGDTKQPTYYTDTVKKENKTNDTPVS